MTYKKSEQVKNRYKFEVELDFKEFEEARQKALEKLGKNVKIAGFRPGKAPQDAVEKEVGYNAYLEAVNKILPKAALEVVEKENLNPISSFNYDLKDLEKDKNIVFTFDFVNQPVIKLDDFKKIKVEYKEAPLGKDEADTVIKNIIKSSLPREKWEKNIIVTQTESKDKKSDNSDDITITDDLIELIGYEDEKTYEGLRKKVEETLEKVKKEDADNAFAGKVIDEAIKIADFEIPNDFVEKEVEHKEEHFRERLKDLKLNEEMYLKTQGTTMDELRKNWREDAEKIIRSDLILINLGVSENLVPTEEEIKAQIEKFQDDTTKQRYNSDENRNYLKTALTRDKALLMLIESAKK